MEKNIGGQTVVVGPYDGGLGALPKLLRVHGPTNAHRLIEHLHDVFSCSANRRSAQVAIISRTHRLPKIFESRGQTPSHIGLLAANRSLP